MIPETRDELIEGLKSGMLPDSVDLSKLDKIVLYEPDEMIIVCEPGITLARLDEELERNQQWIAPLLPAEREERTLAEALATNAYHPRTRFGSPLATSVLGGTFVTLNGNVFRSGSRVVKSVAGYDTHRAYVGSENKLFLPLEITLKVMPRPKEFARFRALANAREEILQRRPLILEEWEGKLIVECAGEPEDIENDRAWLSEHVIIECDLSNEWDKLMIDISKKRMSGQKREPLSPDVETLLLQLRTRINS